MNNKNQPTLTLGSAIQQYESHKALMYFKSFNKSDEPSFVDQRGRMKNEIKPIMYSAGVKMNEECLYELDVTSNGQAILNQMLSKPKLSLNIIELPGDEYIITR